MDVSMQVPQYAYVHMYVRSGVLMSQQLLEIHPERMLHDCTYEYVPECMCRCAHICFGYVLAAFLVSFTHNVHVFSRNVHVFSSVCGHNSSVSRRYILCAAHSHNRYYNMHI